MYPDTIVEVRAQGDCVRGKKRREDEREGWREKKRVRGRGKEKGCCRMGSEIRDRRRRGKTMRLQSK
jgi:hypothetical protein